MAAPRAGTARGRDRGSLSAADWVAAAMDLLATETVRGVRIATLCARLGVTKGSFYWHFPSREALLAAILAEWRRLMTLEVISRGAYVSAPVDEVLKGTLSLSRRRPPGRLGAVERSIRDWARSDPVAQAALEEIDAARLHSLESLFLRRGFAAEEARLRGYAAYSLMMGDSILKGTAGRSVAADRYLDRVVALLLTGEARQPAARDRQAG